MTQFTELLAGYRRFRATRWREQRARWNELKDGQAPRTMIIACSDSRTDPAEIFDTNPGEMFVVRNIANLVPPFERGGGRHGVSAALEFAVTQLKVADIVVMGHGMCGGCEAAYTGRFQSADEGSGGFIAHWVDMLDEAVARVREEHGSEASREALRAVEHEAVRVSLANLRSFPFVRDAEAEGSLTLHGAWFAISDGVLHRLDETTGVFEAEAVE